MFRILITLLTVIAISNAVGIEAQQNIQDSRKFKSESSAVLWSVGATIIPAGVGLGFIGAGTEETGFIIIGTSLIIGPSFGHYYAGQIGRGLLTTGIRVGITSVGLIAALSELIGEEYDEAGAALIITGVCVATVGVIDVTTAPLSARKYNENIMKKGSLQILPNINMDEKKYGLSIVYRF